MKIHFISDNSFFLLGIKEGVAKRIFQSVNLINTNADNFNQINPTFGDVIVLAINDLHLREKIMRMPILHRCKIIMMLNVPMRNTIQNVYPWLIQKNTNAAELIRFLKKSCSVRNTIDSVSTKNREIFFCLGTGQNLDKLSENFSLSVKHIYQVKRMMMHRYGLHGCNSKGVLICRDILYTASSHG